MEKAKIRPPQNLNHLNIFTLKFGTCDYVLHIYPCVKFGCIIVSGGFSPYMWNITLLCLCCPVLLFYSRARIQVEPLDGFSRLMAQTTHFHPWMCYLGVRIIRVKFWGKSPQNSPKWAWLGILHAKWENTKIAIYPKVINVPKSNLNSKFGPPQRLRVWSRIANSHHY